MSQVDWGSIVGTRVTCDLCVLKFSVTSRYIVHNFTMFSLSFLLIFDD
jgi:hypothetical protein